MKNFLIDLYFATVKVNKTRVEVIEGDYKGTVGVVSKIIEINEKTGFIAFRITTEDRNDLTFDNLCAKEIIGNNGIFDYEDIDAWLLDFDKITQEGREFIVETASDYVKDYPNLEVKAKETNAKDGIYVFVQNGEDIISAQTYYYKYLNKNEDDYLLNQSLKKIERDVKKGNLSAIGKLLKSIPKDTLKSFL